MAEIPALYPEAYEAMAKVAYERAYDLSRAVFAIRYSAMHGSPDVQGDKRGQRAAILNLAGDLLERDRDHSMDEALSLWSQYRRMKP
jgi:hypothetical protein